MGVEGSRELTQEVFEQPVEAAVFDEVDAGEFHDLFHLGTVGVGVAVDAAVFTLGLGIEGAFFQFFEGVCFELGAVGAQGAIGAVLLAAVDADEFLQQQLVFLLFVHSVF